VGLSVASVRREPAACAKLIERCDDGVEDQAAEDASWRPDRICHLTLDSVPLASHSRFSAHRERLTVMRVGGGVQMDCAGGAALVAPPPDSGAHDGMLRCVLEGKYRSRLVCSKAQSVRISSLGALKG
jgi:hypothetical protein